MRGEHDCREGEASMQHDNRRGRFRRCTAAGTLAAVLAATLGASPAIAQDCDVHLVVDGPAEGAELGGRSELRGWALDRRAAAGTGAALAA